MRRGGSADAGSEHGHLRQELLDGYFLGRVSTLELLGRTAAHLNGTCPGCRRKLGPDPERYRRALERSAEKLRARAEELAQDRARVRSLVAELGPRSDLDRWMSVTTAARFHTPAFVEHQLGVGWEAVAQGDLPSSREAMELASAAVLALPVERYGSTVRSHLEAEAELLRARIHLGEGELEATERALEVAARWEGEVDGPELRAGILLGRASLHLARGQRPEARAALRAAAATRAGAWREAIREAKERAKDPPSLEGPTASSTAADRPALWREWRRQDRKGLRIRLTLTVASLARRVALHGPDGERTAAFRELAAMCEELVTAASAPGGTPLPGPVVAKLAHFTRKLLSGRVDTEEIRTFEDDLLRLQPSWGPPTMRHHPPGGRFPSEELTDLLAECADELRAELETHGLSEREIEEVLQDATMALLHRWNGLEDRRRWLLERVRRLCLQTVELEAEDDGKPN